MDGPIVTESFMWAFLWGFAVSCWACMAWMVYAEWKRRRAKVRPIESILRKTLREEPRRVYPSERRDAGFATPTYHTERSCGGSWGSSDSTSHSSSSDGGGSGGGGE